MILLSVIVHIHNAEPLVESCIDSLLDQDLPGYEVILVDDGSRDRSLALARQYAAAHPGVVRLYSHTPARGAEASFDRGAEKAAGQYILLVDPADTLQPNCLAAMVGVMERDGVNKLRFGAACTPPPQPDTKPGAPDATPQPPKPTLLQRIRNWFKAR